MADNVVESSVIAELIADGRTDIYAETNELFDITNHPNLKNVTMGTGYIMATVNNRLTLETLADDEGIISIRLTEEE